MKYNFYTRLNIDECKRRLSDKLNPNNTPDKSVAIGKVYGDRFYFEIMKRVGWIRAIMPTSKRFKGMLQSTGNGTNISGSSARSPKDWLFIVLIILLGLMLMSSVVARYGGNPYQVVFVVLMMSWGYFLIPHVPKRENIDFIKDVLEVQNS